MASQPTDLGRPVQEGDVFGPYADLYPGQVITTPCGRVFTVEPDGKHIRCTHVPPSTLYDRGARTESEPIGAKGVFACRDGGREHNTQYYADKYRLSRDTGPGGDHKVHWTDQRVKNKSSSRRQRPPSDAR